MRIGIVGGSIAGCSAAILLLREGHDVTVFERSDKKLVGRGGGIGTLPSLIDQLKAENLLDGDFAFFHISKMPMVGKHRDSEPFGRSAYAIPIDFDVFQWNELWQDLRNRVPDECYHAGVEITGAEMTGTEEVLLITSGGDTMVFDLVLFADGYSSMGRSLMFRDAKLQYRGYVLWRGLLPESEMEDPCPLEHAILRLSYVNEPGHNVMYYIPNQSGSVTEGDRIFNWAAYIVFNDKELEQVMTDDTGTLRMGTLPPGRLSRHNEANLKNFLTKHTPEYYAEVVSRTRDSYIQVIYTLDLDAYYKDRMCLIGDAGIVVQPFTGSGIFKGYQNVKDLITVLNSGLSLDEALKQWSEAQVNTGKRLLALGEQMERAFIWEQPDFATIDAEAAADWWKKSIAFPDDFSFEQTA